MTYMYTIQSKQRKRSVFYIDIIIHIGDYVEYF